MVRIPQLAAPSSKIAWLRSRPESAGNSPRDAAFALDEFLSRGRSTLVLSGAGISVDSNIPDYRGLSVFGDLTGRSCWDVHFK